MSYKLTYFVAKARGETIRMLLHAASVNFEDNRIKFEDWPALKASLPVNSNQMPRLTTPDGKVMTESLAICRYLAAKYNMYSTVPEEIYKIELTIGILFDLFTAVLKTHFVKDAAQKESESKTICETSGPLILGRIQDILEESSTGFLAGTSKLTLADIYLLSNLDNLEGKHDSLLAKFPKLVQHKDKIVAQNPGLSAYMKSRPETSF